MFLWGSQQQQQVQSAQDKLDTGMMPPPVHILQLTGNSAGTGRRSSLLAEQLTMPSPPSFKTEFIEENSRSPLDDDSLEKYPTACDNSMDGSQIMYRRRSVRQPSMDLMDDSSSMSMLVNENSSMDVGNVPSTIVGFQSGLSTLMETNEMSNPSTDPSASELKVMDLCIKQDVQKLASVTNQIEQMIAASSAPLDTLNQGDGLKSQFKVEDMMGTAVQQTGKEVIESTLASIVNSQQAAAAIMDLGSVIPHPSGNPPSMVTPASMMQSDLLSPSNSTIRTSASQDVMLNSQHSMVVTSPASLVLAPSPTSNDTSPHPNNAMSPELILNPTVSPSSMICSPSNATAAATAAAAVAAAAAVSEGTNMLTNQVLNNMAAVAANIIESQPKETTQAVQDIILNAAAEILTSQEPSATTQTTINALITMNAQEMMTTSCQPQSNTQHNLLPQCQPTPMVSNTMADALQQQQQQQIVQNLLTESLQQQQQTEQSLIANLAAAQQQQQNQSQQPQPEQMEIGTAMIPLTVQQPAQQPMDTTGPLVPISSMIHQQPQQQQQPPSMIIQQQPTQQSQLQQQPQGQQQPPVSTAGVSTNIPQELTSMSDNDLISYINPNAFDGV